MVYHQDEPTKDAGPRLLICRLRKTTGRRANPAFPKGSRRIQQRKPRRPFSDDIVNLRPPPENVPMRPFLNGHRRGEQSWPSLETSLVAWPLQSPRSSRYPRLHSSSLSLQANGSGETPALTMSTPVAEPDGGYDWRVRLSTQVVGDSS